MRRYYDIFISLILVAAATLTSLPAQGAGPYFTRSTDIPPGHLTHIERYFDAIADAYSDCVAFAANYGYLTKGYCHGGDSTIVEAGWLCAYGPTGCQDPNAPFHFYLYDGIVCGEVGSRYFPPPIDRCVPVRDRYHDKPDSCSANVGFGNPIYPMTGSKRYSVEFGAWFGGLFQLRYDTRRKILSNNETSKFIAAAPASFGELWETSIHKRLIIQGGPGKAIQASRGLGVWVSFAADGFGNYVPDIDVGDSVKPFSGGWRYVDAISQSEEIYDERGVLLFIRGADGVSFSFTYSNSSTPLAVAPLSGLLIKAQDQYGRSAQFFYEQPAAPGVAPRIIGITDPAGQNTNFGYDAAGNLIQITWPDASRRQFMYGRSDRPWALTDVVDEKGSAVANYFYDGAGRAIATQGAGGVNRYSTTWSAAPTWQITETYDQAAGVVWRDHNFAVPEGTVVSLPNGQTSRLTVSNILGTPRLGGQSQAAGSGCTAASSNQVFDGYGNVVQQDDFNGNRVCYGFDVSRNLETMKVEGLGSGTVCAAFLPGSVALPVGGRKTSTEWHPDWRLQSRIAGPGKVVTSIYNGQPDPFNAGALANCAPAAVLSDGKPIAVLCRRVEQATSDADGSLGFAAPLAATASREQRWTYSQDGQVLTHDGPRSDVADLTSYAYYGDTTADHTRGDRRAMTNPAGHVTNYLRYNPAGKLLAMVDPNSVLTTNTYDLRQRLTSTTVGSLTTVYTYDLAGQLVRVTNPDGAYTGYAYDAAHRLVAVFDNLGNRIDYTLDAAGKRTVERVTDDNGMFRRQLSRSFDALGRPQQITGRE